MDGIELEQRVALRQYGYDDLDDNRVEVDYDSFGEQIIVRSTPKPKRPRLTQSKPRSATTTESTNGEAVLLARFVKAPNQILFDKDLSHGEVRVYLALLAYDWNEKGHSDYSEEHMAGHLGLCVRQYRTCYSSLVKKGYIRQVRHGEHTSATTFPRIRVEANTVVDSYRKG